MFGPPVSPREYLIAALAALTAPSSPERAAAVIDALDAYLEDTDGRAPVPFLVITESAQMEILRRKLDEAVARAEKAEKALRPPKPAARRVSKRTP